MYEVFKNELIRLFWATDAIKTTTADKPFVLASGKLSTLFIDCKRLLLHPDGASVACGCLSQRLAPYSYPEAKEEFPLYIGGIGVGGALLVGLLLRQTEIFSFRHWRGFIVRDVAKDHGLGEQLAGYCDKNGKIILVEDVVTSGGSIDRAQQVLEKHGYEPADVYALVDRQEPKIDKPWVDKLTCILTKEEILNNRPSA
jgi:orotate phosphoribosyltransferase